MANITFNERRDSPIWNVMRLAANAETSEQAFPAAMEAKRLISEEALNLWNQLKVLDDLMLYMFPKSGWNRGWSIFPGDEAEGIELIPINSPTLPRTKQIIYISQELGDAKSVISSDWSITTREVAERLERQGYPGSLRDLAIAAGNVLSRNGWKKVGDGEYASVLEAAVNARKEPQEANE